ncbi:hypothetical protein D3C78_1552790 [compost metagenome]
MEGAHFHQGVALGQEIELVDPNDHDHAENQVDEEIVALHPLNPRSPERRGSVGKPGDG